MFATLGFEGGLVVSARTGGELEDDRNAKELATRPRVP